MSVLQTLNHCVEISVVLFPCFDEYNDVMYNYFAKEFYHKLLNGTLNSFKFWLDAVGHFVESVVTELSVERSQVTWFYIKLDKLKARIGIKFTKHLFTENVT